MQQHSITTDTTTTTNTSKYTKPGRTCRVSGRGRPGGKISGKWQDRSVAQPKLSKLTASEHINTPPFCVPRSLVDRSTTHHFGTETREVNLPLRSLASGCANELKIFHQVTGRIEPVNAPAFSKDMRLGAKKSEREKQGGSQFVAERYAVNLVHCETVLFLLLSYSRFLGAYLEAVGSISIGMCSSVRRKSAEKEISTQRATRCRRQSVLPLVRKSWEFLFSQTDFVPEFTTELNSQQHRRRNKKNT